jgi:hypothetical protein
MLHDRDKCHPNVLGSYLAAYVFFATLFDQSPVGLATDITGLQKQNAERLRSLQDIAWRTVKAFRRI